MKIESFEYTLNANLSAGMDRSKKKKLELIQLMSEKLLY